jgi:NAD-dependent SIR2 family protein deacetylase
MINKAKKVLDEAEVIIITSGAGMGVDSGLPDFRGNEGMWKEYPVLKELKLNFSSIANPKQFKLNPKVAWGFYGHRYDIYKRTRPNAGFTFLRELLKAKKDYFIVTSNVDGHFQKAGFNTDKIYEVHGRINKLQCTKCDTKPWDIDDDKRFGVNSNTFELSTTLPYCKKCNAIARPNIMMFDDYSYDYSISEAQENRFNNFMRKYDKNGTKIAIIEIGAGTAISTIRHIGEQIHNKIETATLIRINPRESQVPNGAIGLATTGKVSLRELCKDYMEPYPLLMIDQRELEKNKNYDKNSDAGIFADELSPENEKRVDDIMLALALNKAAKAELKRREAEERLKKSLGAFMEPFFDDE